MVDAVQLGRWQLGARNQSLESVSRCLCSSCCHVVCFLCNISVLLQKHFSQFQLYQHVEIIRPSVLVCIKLKCEIASTVKQNKTICLKNKRTKEKKKRDVFFGREVFFYFKATFSASSIHVDDLILLPNSGKRQFLREKKVYIFHGVVRGE
jgi:hypothetical protein